MRRPASAGCDRSGTLPIEDALKVQYKRKPAYMKKNSNSKSEQKVVGKEQNEQKLFLMKMLEKETKGLTVGLDLGDRGSSWCAVGADGEVIARGEVVNEKQPMELFFSRIPVSRVAMEVGTHSPWVSRLVEKQGHEVIVANAHRVKLISASSNKNDRRDAEFLARLARADLKLLSPIRHRGEAAQGDLVGVRVRAQLVEMRTTAINAARGLVKSFGQRLPKCDADNLGKEHAQQLEPAIRGHVERLLEVIEGLSKQIAECDKELKKISAERYQWETAQLQQVGGVGVVTALTFVLTLDDATRFSASRDVGCFVGLRPKGKQSGASEPEMRISKEGDVYLRKLLVQCSQYILSKRGEDTDLKRWGLQIAGKGKKNAKKRAVVAVARKLAVLLHRLWVSGEKYEPLRNSSEKAKAA
jgi:transposase